MNHRFNGTNVQKMDAILQEKTGGDCGIIFLQRSCDANKIIFYLCSPVHQSIDFSYEAQVAEMVDAHG
jgi:hypothetical protein